MECSRYGQLYSSPRDTHTTHLANALKSLNGDIYGVDYFRKKQKCDKFKRPTDPLSNVLFAHTFGQAERDRKFNDAYLPFVK